LGVFATRLRKGSKRRDSHLLDDDLRYEGTHLEKIRGAKEGDKRSEVGVGQHRGAKKKKKVM